MKNLSFLLIHVLPPPPVCLPRSHISVRGSLFFFFFSAAAFFSFEHGFLHNASHLFPPLEEGMAFFFPPRFLASPSREKDNRTFFTTDAPFLSWRRFLAFSSFPLYVGLFLPLSLGQGLRIPFPPSLGGPGAPFHDEVVDLGLGRPDRTFPSPSFLVRWSSRRNEETVELSLPKKNGFLFLMNK